jgi:hypothetical protein
MTWQVMGQRRKLAGMRGVTLFAASVLAGCAALGPALPPPGAGEADVQRMLGTPTGRYALPAGGTRLEYATGPWGRHTWMVDLDAAGRVTAARQVLGEAELAAFQARAPGMPQDELLRTLGRPGERRPGGWAGGEVWSWRYPTNDCLWFQVSIGDDRRVTAGAFGIDPACDPPSDRN